jgi:peptide/nickel transport system permease protein
MKIRLLFLLALWLPELSTNSFHGDAPASLMHPLGFDELGRDALLRLSLGASRSLGFASACALLSLALAWMLALSGTAWRPTRSALRSVPPLLFLIPLSMAAGGLGWVAMGFLMSLLFALHAESPLTIKLDHFRASPAWRMETLMGASMPNRFRRWAPWAMDQITPLFPSIWLAAIWGEASLSAMGLGPGPEHDSLGRLLAEELPRLSTDPTRLGIATLAVLLALAWSSTLKTKEAHDPDR